MSTINLAIAGVGNCASSLVQGVEYYKDVDEKSGLVPGILHNTFGSYRIRDIKFVAAFDIDKEKVGKDLSEAIFTGPNCAAKFCSVRNLSVKVEKAKVLDGLGRNLKQVVHVNSQQKEVNVAEVLQSRHTDVFINYLPAGSKKASEYYAEQSLKAGCGFINAIPELIASSTKWGKKFKDAGLPLAGDDIKSQIGGTIVHRTLTQLFLRRGAKIKESYQFNVGGNMDFYNLSEEARYGSKLVSKNKAVQSLVPYETQIVVTPSSYVGFLGDKKECYIMIKGEKFGKASVTVEVKLSIEDSPNSAGVIVDVIRAMKIALDKGISGPLEDVSAYYFKSPPKQYSDDEAYRMVEKFNE